MYSQNRLAVARRRKGDATHRLEVGLCASPVENKVWLAVIFRMSYQDIFGTEHWLDKCQSIFDMEPGSLVSSPPGAGACTDYNKTDEN